MTAKGQFSDFPYYLFTEYFDKLNAIKGEEREDNDISLYETIIFTPPQLDWNSALGFLDWHSIYNTTESQLYKSRLIGPRTTIVTQGSMWTNFYAKIEDYGYKRIKLMPVQKASGWREGNYLHFLKKNFDEYAAGIYTIGEDPGDWEDGWVKEQVGDNTFAIVKHDILGPENGAGDGYHYRFKRYKLKNLVEDMIVEPGTNIYLRKDSLFNDWFKRDKKYELSKTGDLDRTDIWDHEDFYHDEKMFSYVGKIYNDYNGNENVRTVEYYGLKDFMMAVIPPNDLTLGLRDWAWETYDKVHLATYNMQKNLNTMLDPDEIPHKFLGYLAKFYDYDVDIFSVEEPRQREHIKSIIYQLKRKGAWAGILSAWKVLATDTKNALNLYERWHRTKLVKEEILEDEIYDDRITKTCDFSFDNISSMNNKAFETSEFPEITFISSETEGYVPFQVKFTSVTQDEFDEYNWDFGDGQVSTISSPIYSHIFKTTGDKLVTLKAKHKEFGEFVATRLIKAIERIVKYTLSFTSNNPNMKWRIVGTSEWHDLTDTIDLETDTYYIEFIGINGFELPKKQYIDLNYNKVIDVQYKAI